MPDFVQRFTVGRRGRVKCLQLGRKFIHRLLNLHNVPHRAQHLIQQGFAGDMNTILRQIPHMGVAGQQHLTVVRLHSPHNTLHEGRLTGTVLPCERDTLSSFNNKGERIKEHAGTELYVKVLYGKNHYLPSLLFQRVILAACSSKRSAQSS